MDVPMFVWRTPTQLFVESNFLDLDFLEAARTDIKDVLLKGRILKQCRGRCISRVETNDGTVIVKMFRERSWWHVLKRLVLRSRARLYCERANDLLSRGVSTTKPIAIIEEHYGAFTGNSCVIYRYLQGRNLYEFAADIAENKLQTRAEKRDILENAGRHVGQLAERLSELGFVHTDIHPTNFVIDCHLNVHLIDIEALQRSFLPYRLQKSREKLAMLMS